MEAKVISFFVRRYLELMKKGGPANADARDEWPRLLHESTRRPRITRFYQRSAFHFRAALNGW
jgi:hypothetical protein